MGGAEGVQYKHVGKCGQCHRKLGIVLLLPRLEACVLEHGNRPGSDRRQLGEHVGPGDTAQLGGREATHLAEPGRHRRQAQRRIEPFRPSQVAAHHDLCTPLS